MIQAVMRKVLEHQSVYIYDSLQSSLNGRHFDYYAHDYNLVCNLPASMVHMIIILYDQLRNRNDFISFIL